MIKPPGNNAKGFSLIEITVVLVLVVFIILTFSNRMGRGNRQLRKDVRYFAGMMREIRTKARVKNMTYRLVITLPVDKEEPQTFTVESTGKKALINYEELAEQQKIKKKSFRSDGSEDEETPADPSGFQEDSHFAKNGHSLPAGLYFKSVELAADNKEFTSGRVFIHFFPEGRVEEAVVHLTDRDQLHWALALHPLTGRVDIISGEATLKQLKQQ